jgi:hypothetical protein
MELIALPLDILNLLVDQLTQRELKKVRLVCRTLHSVATLRIPRVFLSPNRSNTDTFRAILSHEGFRRQVREIVWDDARLEFYDRQPLSFDEHFTLSEDLRLGYVDPEIDPKKFEHYEHEVQEADGYLNKEKKSARKKELWGYDAPDMNLEESFDLYSRLYEEQQDIIKAGEDVETLKLGLVSFPALTRVTVTSETWQLNPLFPRYETPFFRSLPPGFQMPTPWPWLGRDYDELSEAQMERLMLPWDESYEEWRGYQVVVDALLATISVHKVKEFIIDTNHENTGISYQLFASPEQIGYMQTVKLFQAAQLTTLELSVNTRTAGRVNFSCFHNQLLRSALSRLTSLKSLRLSTSISTRDDDHIFHMEQGWVKLDEIIPLDMLAPTLQSLKLCNFFMNGEALYSGLASLLSLTNMWFESIELHQSFTWRPFLFRIKNQLVQDTTCSSTWSRRKPEMIVRRRGGSNCERLDSSAEVKAFLYGNGICPFTEAHPSVSNVGMIVDLWDEDNKRYMNPLGLPV